MRSSLRLLVALGILIIGGVGLAWQFRDTWQPTLFSSPRLNTVQVQAELPPEVTLETVATGLEVPWSLVFTAPNRLLVAERPGRIRVILDGQLQTEPLHTIPDVVSDDEEGLMGLVAHPRYTDNHWLYASYAYRSGRELAVKVIRLRDDGNRLELDRAILENIPAARFHAGSQLVFGPDEKLYITTGDATDKNLAQDRSSLAGKILRLNDDGSIPSDNPFHDSPVFTLGHRNPQGLDWDPQTQRWYSTEHGPSGFDGPGGGDEINFIEAGKNYGWPTIHHEATREGLEAPLVSYTPAEAPGSGHFYRGEALPQYQGHYFFGALKGEGLWHVTFDPENPRTITSQEKLFDHELGRLRAITTGPDGALYFATSNRDGRGRPESTDDRILRLIPAQ